MGPGDVSDVTHWKRGLRFEKKQLVEFMPLNERVDIQSWARQDEFVHYGRRAFVEEIVSLSPHVEKPLTQRQKSFVPETIS